MVQSLVDALASHSLFAAATSCMLLHSNTVACCLLCGYIQLIGLPHTLSHCGVGQSFHFLFVRSIQVRSTERVTDVLQQLFLPLDKSPCFQMLLDGLKKPEIMMDIVDGEKNIDKHLVCVQ